MAGITYMKRSTKGFYTVEAAIFLPFVILAVLSLGYFMKIEGLWENCIHGAVDESAVIAAKAYNGTEPMMTASKVRQRIEEDNPQLDSIEIKNVRIMYADSYNDNLISYRIKAEEKLALPLSFQWTFALESEIKFRGFVGKRESGNPLGAEGLESEAAKQPVWIFPRSGEKYHTQTCTYVKAAVRPVVLTGSLKNRYDACGICGSGSMPAGSIVFCFGSEDTSYHRGTCRTINRRTVVIDKMEAVEKGYTPCTKCGG